MRSLLLLLLVVLLPPLDGRHDMEATGSRQRGHRGRRLMSSGLLAGAMIGSRRLALLLGPRSHSMAKCETLVQACLMASVVRAALTRLSTRNAAPTRGDIQTVADIMSSRA